MKFYNLKTRSHIDVPESEVRKTKMERPTRTGKQVRYALTANYQGNKLFKFISEKDYKASSAKDA